MKPKTSFLCLLMLCAFSLNAQISKIIHVPFESTIVLDPASIDPSYLLYGFSVVDIDGEAYFKVELNAWESWIDIPEAIVPEGASHLKLTAKYDEDVSGVPVNHARSFFKLFDSNFMTIAQGGDSSSSEFTEYHIPVNSPGTAVILQVAAMDTSAGYIGVVGAIQYVSKIEAIAEGNPTYNFSFNNEINERTVEIVSGINWSISSDQAWLTLDKTSGSGNDVVTLTAEANTGSSRVATATIHAEGYDDQFIVVSQSGVYNVTPGGLQTIMADQLETVAGFKLTGSIDARDFKTMRDSMPLLEEVDLSEVSIVAYSGTEGTLDMDTSYSANVFPDRAFCGSDNSGKPGLKNIILPNTTVSLGKNAFRSCTGLTNIFVPNSVTKIDNQVFLNCSGLSQIEFEAESNLDSIGRFAFYQCTSLTEITIPVLVKLIDQIAFYGCSQLSSVLFESNQNLTTIGYYAFGYCGQLSSFTVPQSVTSIGALAFVGSGANITVEEENQNYSSSDGVLFNKDQTNLIFCPPSKTGGYYIPTTVTNISQSAFYNCVGINYFNIPGSVTSIEDWAFENCSGLTSLTLPSAVNFIGSHAFYNCSNLKTFNVGSVTPVDLSERIDVFFGVDQANCILNVPTGSKSAYESAVVWQDFANIYEPVAVTFRVNMQNETISPNGVHINGSFSDWAEAVAMNVESESIYSATIDLPVGETFTYKFVNGGTFEWENYEIPPEKCTAGENNDREILVPDADIILDVVCFNSCYNCDKQDELNVAIKRTPKAPVIDGLPDYIWDKVDAVPIERDFLGENPTVTASWKAMYDNDNIYVLVEVQDDDHYPAWEAGSGNYWEYDQAELFFDVNNQLLDGLGPSTAGSGHWAFSEAMQEAGYGNLQESYALAAPVSWCYTLSGQNYMVEYAFPFNSLTQGDGTVLDVNGFKDLGAFGFDVTIDDRDTVKDTRDRKVWQNIGEQAESWANMDDCGTISLNDEVIIQDSVPVTFLVDMQNEVVDPSGVFVAGDWDPNLMWNNPVQMTAAVDNDVYWVVVNMPVGTSFNYKFKNGNTWEDIQGDCTVTDYRDRHYDLGNEYAVIDLVCFGSCQSCEVENAPVYTIREIQGDGDVSPLDGQLIRTKGRITGVNEYGCFIQDTTGARSGIYIYDPNLPLQFVQGDNIEIVATVSEYNGRTELSGTQYANYISEDFWVSLFIC